MTFFFLSILQFQHPFALQNHSPIVVCDCCNWFFFAGAERENKQKTEANNNFHLDLSVSRFLRNRKLIREVSGIKLNTVNPLNILSYYFLNLNNVYIMNIFLGKISKILSICFQSQSKIDKILLKCAVAKFEIQYH